MRRSAALGLAVVAITLAACSGSGSSPNGQAAVRTHLTTSLPVAADPQPGQGPAPPIAGAQSGGTVTIWAGQQGHPFAPSLDPSDTYYTSTVAIESGLLIRSLTQYVYDPKSQAMVLVPDLATDLGRPNADFTVWTFTLRAGLRFDNGRPITAEDVKFGIERSFDRKAFPEGPPYLNEYFLDGPRYHGPYRSPGPYRGVSVSGHTLTLRMRKPFPDLPYFAAFPAMSPIPAGRASNPATYKHRPWASGPYRVASYSAGRSLVLVRNPYWDPSSDPGRHQYADRFVFDLFTPVDTQIARSLVGGRAPGPTSLSSVDLSAADHDLLQTLAPDQLVEGTLPCSQVFFPDNRKITDVAVRRALAYAYPYRTVWRLGDLLPGVTALPATTVVPPGIPGRLPDNPIGGHRPASTDPDKARALLAHAGKLGFRIRFAYPADDPTQVRISGALVRAFDRAGFRTTAIRTTSARWGDEVLHNPDAPVNVRTVGWCADWPSMGAWLDQTLSTPGPDDADFWVANFGYFSNPAVDARIRQIQRLPVHEQPSAWQSLATRVQHRFLPMFPTRYYGVDLARGSRVHGVHVDPMLGTPTYKDVWVE